MVIKCIKHVKLLLPVHKYDVSLTLYCKTTLELVTTFNCLERQLANANSTVTVTEGEDSNIVAVIFVFKSFIFR